MIYLSKIIRIFIIEFQFSHKNDFGTSNDLFIYWAAVFPIVLFRRVLSVCRWYSDGICGIWIIKFAVTNITITAGNLSFSAYLTSIIKNEYFFKNVSNRWHSGSEGQVQLDIKWLRNYVFKTSACDNNSVATYSKRCINGYI